MDFIPAIELYKEPKTARVERMITPRLGGRVFFEGTYWPARLYDRANTMLEDYVMDVSSRVTVIGRQGLTLLVVPLAAPAYV
jgi:membrane protein implicated in regulation of membrane protease activity